MTEPQSIPTIVAAGVAYLDSHDDKSFKVAPPPQFEHLGYREPWFCYIETLKLNQSSTCDCVLGQRFGSYSWGCSWLKIGEEDGCYLWNKQEFLLGFDLGPHEMYAEYEGLKVAAKTFKKDEVYQDTWIRSKLFKLLTDEWKRVIAEKQDKYKVEQQETLQCKEVNP